MKYFGNPFNIFCEQNFCNNPSISNLSNERKEYIINTCNNFIKLKDSEDLSLIIEKKCAKVNSEILNFLYQCYEYNDKYKDFINNPYLRYSISLC